MEKKVVGMGSAICSFADVVTKKDYKDLVSCIGELLAENRRRALQTVNDALVRTYWNNGRHIVEFEQKGNVRASYGDKLLVRLSKDLTIAYGKGFSRSNLFMIRQFYVRFPKFQTVSGKLSWSHYAEILKSDSELEIGFYGFSNFVTKVSKINGTFLYKQGECHEKGYCSQARSPS